MCVIDVHNACCAACGGLQADTQNPQTYPMCFARRAVKLCSAASLLMVAIAAGKLSGQAAVTSRLKGLGYTLTKEQMSDVFIRFKASDWNCHLRGLTSCFNLV